MKFLGKDVGYWMGWALAAIMAVGLLVVLAGVTIYRDAVCTGHQEEQCLREWISASGAWAAVIVGAPTILYLAKQVKDADRFHRQILAMSLEKSITLAKRINRRCSNERRRIDRIRPHIKYLNAMAGPYGNSTVLQQETAKMIVRLAENISEADFDEFENITFVGATYLRSARKALSAAKRIAEPASATSAGIQISAKSLRTIDSAVTRAESHLQRLMNHSRDYLKKWDVAASTDYHSPGP